MSAPSLPYIEATVKHLEQVTTETAEEVKNLGKIMARMEGHIENQGKQIDHVHRMIDGLVDNATTKGEFKDHEDRLRALEREPADKWKGATGLVVTFFIGAVLAFIAARLGLTGGS